MNRIKELRERKGMTQTELGEKLGVIKSTVCHYESGKSEPSIETLKEIAKIFDVSFDYLLGEEKDFLETGEKIRSLRIENCMDQEDLAKKLGVSQKSISKYELGERKPKYGTLIAIADTFGVSVDYLLGNDVSDAKSNVFGERLKRIRTEKGVTQEELAKAVCSSRSNIAGYETCNKAPSQKMIVKIAQYFGVSVDYLLGNDVSLSPKNNRAQRNGNNQEMAFHCKQIAEHFIAIAEILMKGE